MAMVEKFEDLMAWQKARHMASGIYRATARSSFDRDWPLRDQMRRAAVSVAANIAEGFGRSSRREFAHYLVIARGSCTELSSHCYIAEDNAFLDAVTAADIRGEAEEVARIIGGLRRSLDTRKSRN